MRGRSRAWPAAGLCAAALLGGCRTMAMHHSQGGITVTAGDLEIGCDVHNGQVGYSFSGMSIVSSRGPITRTLWQLGVDSNGNGRLDPTEVLQSIDNTHPGQSSVIAGFQGSMGAGSTVIAHVEVFTTGESPVYSKTWKHS